MSPYLPLRCLLAFVVGYAIGMQFPDIQDKLLIGVPLAMLAAFLINVGMAGMGL